MNSRKNNPSGVKKYISKLELAFEYIMNDAELLEEIDDIALYLELSYGVGVKEKFLKLVEPGNHESSLKRMVAFLHSVDEGVFDNSSTSNSLGKNTTKVAKLNKSVFIVHGHDDEAKETVARFVSKLSLDPVILHERPNSGKTIIEKLESNAEEISFAIVLLTPDDKGSSIKANEYKYRARQNVIYELGFFNAKLGRDKVCVLKKGDIELLSDYLGVVYVDMDKNGGWKNQLARELKQAGLQVSSEDIEKALLT